MTQNKRSFLVVLLLIIISLLTYRRWISFDIFSSGDWGFLFSQSLKEYAYPSAWISNLNLGQIDLLIWRTPLNVLYGLLGYLGFDQNISEKLILIWPSVIISNLSIFLLSRKIFKSDIVGFISALIYNYNTYFFTTATAFLIYAANSFFLMSFYFFMSALESNRKWHLLLSVLLFFISGSLDFRVLYIGAFMLLLYWFYFVFFIKNIFEIKKIIKLTIFPVVFFVAIGLLNLYWVITLLNSQSLVSNFILNRGLFGNEFLNLLYALTLFHPYWTGTATAVFEVQPIKIYFWLYPLFAMLGLYMGRRNKYVTFFAIVGILGILLTKQVGIPFPDLYEWLFTHLPGFNGFREASKFYLLTILGYSILIGSLCNYLIAGLKDKKFKVINFILLLSILSLILIITKPIFTGQIQSVYVNKAINKDYLIYRDFLLNDKNFSRTLWVPNLSRWSFYSNAHPIVSFTEIIQNDWRNYISDPDKNFFAGEKVINVIEKPYFNNLLNVSSIKYVAIPTRDIKNNDDLFKEYGNFPRETYISRIASLKNLKKLDIDTSELILYENPSYKPHIYLTNKKETIKEYIDFRQVDHRSINPTKYEVNLKNITSPVYLNFSENYGPMWKIRIGKFNIFQTLFYKNYFLPDKYHSRNDANLNSYFIDPNKECNSYSCIKNEDGSYDLDIVLFYKPQAYIIFGMLISGLFLVSILILLFYFLIKERHDKKN